VPGERRPDLLRARVERGEHGIGTAVPLVPPRPVGQEDQGAEDRGRYPGPQVRRGVDALPPGKHPDDVGVTVVHVAQVGGEQRRRAVDQPGDEQVSRGHRIISGDRPQRLGERVAQRGQRLLGRGPGRQLPQQRVRPVPGEGQRQVLLAREVPEERALGDVNGIGDLPHRGVLVSLGVEQLQGSADQRLPGLPFLPLPARRGRHVLQHPPML
jgi:hypothetical protein